MNWNETLTALNYYLADLYFDQDRARRIAKVAGLKTGLIDFDGDAYTIWFNILEFASANEQRLQQLLSAVTLPNEKGGDDEYLKGVLENLKAGKLPIATPKLAPNDWKGSVDSGNLEKLMSSKSTLLPISFLERGVECAKSVARIDLGNSFGTGFLVQGNFLITNNHVLPNADAARRAKAQFNYQTNWNGNALALEAFDLDADQFVTSKDLDCSIVKVNQNPNATYGQLELSQQAAQVEDFVNIIQHPAGGPKQIAMYHNVVAYADDLYIQYLTDTLEGSSGSPVFNSDWKVTALHHRGGNIREPGTNLPVRRNEGINILKVVELLTPLLP